MAAEEGGASQGASSEDFPVEYVEVADVNTGDVPLDDVSLWLVDNNGIWTDYLIKNHYETDHHRYMMGVTSPNGFQGNTAAFAQLAAATMLWVCDWTCERIGEQPTLPSPNPSNDNVILLDEHYEMAQIVPGPDGNHVVWRISGTYVFGFKNYKTANLFYPRPPWVADIPNRGVNPVFDKNLKDQESQGFIDPTLFANFLNPFGRGSSEEG